MEQLKQGIQEVEVAADAFKLAKAKVRCDGCCCFFDKKESEKRLSIFRRTAESPLSRLAS
jgi:hypothetical protein